MPRGAPSAATIRSDPQHVPVESLQSLFALFHQNPFLPLFKQPHDIVDLPEPIFHAGGHSGRHFESGEYLRGCNT